MKGTSWVQLWVGLCNGHSIMNKLHRCLIRVNMGERSSRDRVMNTWGKSMELLTRLTNNKHKLNDRRWLPKFA